MNRRPGPPRSAAPAREALRCLPRRRRALPLQAADGSLERAERRGAGFVLARAEQAGRLLVGEFAGAASRRSFG